MFICDYFEIKCFVFVAFSDSEYQKFLDILKNPETEPTVPIEAYLEELENKKKELKGLPVFIIIVLFFSEKKKSAQTRFFLLSM